MRIVTFYGIAVKRQKKLPDGNILVQCYDRPAQVVTPAEWDRESSNKFFAAGIRRRDVVRQS